MLVCQVVKYLLKEASAQLEAKDEYQGRPLHMAALYGHDKVVEFLLNHGAEVSQSVNSTPTNHPLPAGQRPGSTA